MINAEKDIGQWDWPMENKIQRSQGISTIISKYLRWWTVYSHLSYFMWSKFCIGAPSSRSYRYGVALFPNLLHGAPISSEELRILSAELQICLAVLSGSSGELLKAPKFPLRSVFCSAKRSREAQFLVFERSILDVRALEKRMTKSRSKRGSIS